MCEVWIKKRRESEEKREKRGKKEGRPRANIDRSLFFTHLPSSSLSLSLSVENITCSLLLSIGKGQSTATLAARAVFYIGRL